MTGPSDPAPGHPLARSSHDARRPLDARLDPALGAASRAGLAGTEPANLYDSPRETGQITIAPDWRPMEDQPRWRTDFPIDWPQDHYVERREFVKFLFLTSLAFAAGQLWIGAHDWWRRRRPSPPARRVATLAEIPVGGVVTFGYPGPDDDCVLARPRADTLVAYGQKCTHLSCAVVPRVEQGLLRCPCHEGWFALASGRPVAGPPRRPLPLVRLELRGDDIYATGVEERTA
jgi:nitrite reductase/ring-hydroxylating ferredoxin subunit